MGQHEYRCQQSRTIPDPGGIGEQQGCHQDSKSPRFVCKTAVSSLELTTSASLSTYGWDEVGRRQKVEHQDEDTRGRRLVPETESPRPVSREDKLLLPDCSPSGVSTTCKQDCYIAGLVGFGELNSPSFVVRQRSMRRSTCPLCRLGSHQDGWTHRRRSMWA